MIGGNGDPDATDPETVTTPTTVALTAVIARISTAGRKQPVAITSSASASGAQSERTAVLVPHCAAASRNTAVRHRMWIEPAARHVNGARRGELARITIVPAAASAAKAPTSTGSSW